jgi:glycosyltransferase involved in cell wall biosynthesis
MKLNQLLPGFGGGDAISNFALSLQGIARAWGLESAIYCEQRHVHPAVEGSCEDYRRCPSPGDPSDITLYHYSVGSPVSGFFRGLRTRRILVYHNITPHEWFRGVHEEKMRALWEGREELRSLAGVPDLSLGVSEFNRRELEEYGFSPTGVLPLIADAARLSAGPDPVFMRRFGDGAANILFVGRVVPNKRVEDLVRAYYCFRNTVAPRSRLIVAGSMTGMDRYTASLRALVTLLDLPDVVFLNHVTDAQLYALYRTASVFLSMSEHEGFCIPLIEAMHFRVPVVAYAAAAIPETLAGAGVLLREKDFAAVAELLGALVSNTALRAAVVERQLPRAAAFSRETAAGRLRELLRPWLP